MVISAQSAETNPLNGPDAAAAAVPGIPWWNRQHLLENPELLEKPLSEEVDY